MHEKGGVSKIISNFEVDESNGKVVVSINPKIFPVSLVSKTASLFRGNCWVTIDGDLEDEVLVELRPKKGEDLKFIARKFNNKLLEQSTNEIKVEKENPALISKIKEVVQQFIADEKGRISKQSIITIGAILAGIGLAGIIPEDAAATHMCSGGGGDGGGGGDASGGGSGEGCEGCSP